MASSTIKKRLLDPGFIILLGVNLYSVYFYYYHPDRFTTIIWLYWSQSVCLGFFNALDIATLKNYDISIFKRADNVTVSNASMKNFTAVFFLIHFGFFHFVYLFFLIGIKKTGPFDWYFYQITLSIFLIGQVFNFIPHKIAQRKNDIPVNVNTMFFIPYLRVVPMHLCILLPAFFHFSNLMVFIILKVIFDALMYMSTRPGYIYNHAK